MNTALLRKVLGNTGPEFRALTLSGNEITDATRALGIQGDGLLNDSSYGIWPAATNLRLNGGFETNATGWAGAASATVARAAKIADTFTRANGAIGTAETGQTWVQVAAGGAVVLATVSGNALVAADSGAGATAAYSGIDLGAGRKPLRMAATISWGAGVSRYSAAAIICNVGGLSTVSNITVDGSLHITFGDTSCAVGWWFNNVLTNVGSYTYSSACARDGVSTYNVGWSLNGSTVIVEMPDGTTQTYTDANFATYSGRYCTFEHYRSAADETMPTFLDVTIDNVAKFGTSCLTVSCPGGAAGEGVEATAISVTAGNPYAEGVWVKAPSGATMRMQLAERLIADAVDITVTNTDFTGTGAWQSVAVTKTLGATAVVERLRILTVTSAQSIDFQVDGSQLETGTVRTPSIATSAGTAARSASRVRVPTPLPVNVTQGWAAIRLRTGFASTVTRGIQNGLFALTVDANNYVVISISDGNGNCSVSRNGSATFGNATSTASHALGDYKTFIGYWTATQLGASVNGSVFTTGAQSAIPVGTPTLDIGSWGVVNTAWLAACDILWFACGSGVLSNGDAATIHAFGNSDRGLDAFPGNPSGYWSAASGFMEVRS